MHQSVIKVTRWNLKVISLRIPLHLVSLITMNSHLVFNTSEIDRCIIYVCTTKSLWIHEVRLLDA